MNGKLIVLEGGEGAGKGTAIERLKLVLPPCTVFTREPGGTEVAERLRQILKHEDLNPLTQLLGFFAARADHYQKVIKPALLAGKHVVSDRLDGSTYAYQVWAGSDGDLQHEFLQLRRLVCDPIPNFYLLFDVDPEVGLERSRVAGNQDRIELMGLEFHRKVLEGYHVFMDRFVRNRGVIIDAGRAPSEVGEEAVSIILSRLGN